MACTLPATGPCTIVADGPCALPKVYNEALGLLTPSFVQGYDGYFEVQWTVEPESLDQSVTLLYRERLSGVFTEPRIVALHSAGAIQSLTGYDISTIFEFGIRRCNATEFGPWYRGTAVCSDSWDSESEIVQHFAEQVLHGTRVVLHNVP